MISEKYHIVPVFSDEDLNVGATASGDSINMRHFHSACFIVNCQALAGASATLELYSGATDGALTSALTFRYAWGGAAAAAANCDVLAAWTSAATVTLTHGTYDNYMLIMEINAAAMDVANQEEWLTLLRTDPGGATGNITCHAVLAPRYPTYRHASALV